jgi:hypothetical protein
MTPSLTSSENLSKLKPSSKYASLNQNHSLFFSFLLDAKTRINFLYFLSKASLKVLSS